MIDLFKKIYSYNHNIFYYHSYFPNSENPTLYVYIYILFVFTTKIHKNSKLFRISNYYSKNIAIIKLFFGHSHLLFVGSESHINCLLATVLFSKFIV
jgi:hypothetical protein